MQNLINYIKWSNFTIEFMLNPFRWSIYTYVETKSDMDPGLIFLGRFIVGPIAIHIIIDDGSW